MLSYVLESAVGLRSIKVIWHVNTAIVGVYFFEVSPNSIRVVGSIASVISSNKSYRCRAASLLHKANHAAAVLVELYVDHSLIEVCISFLKNASIRISCQPAPNHIDN